MIFDHLSHKAVLDSEDIKAIVSYIEGDFPSKETPYLVSLFVRASYDETIDGVCMEQFIDLGNKLSKKADVFNKEGGFINIYLDDVRPTPPGYTHCRWPDELAMMYKLFNVMMISLDHDLGDDDRGTGNTAVNWIEDYVYTNNLSSTPQIKVHSDNGPGIQKMRNGINQIANISEINRLKG